MSTDESPGQRSRRQGTSPERDPADTDEDREPTETPWALLWDEVVLTVVLFGGLLAFVSVLAMLAELAGSVRL